MRQTNAWMWQTFEGLAQNHEVRQQTNSIRQPMNVTNRFIHARRRLTRLVHRLIDHPHGQASLSP